METSGRPNGSCAPRSSGVVGSSAVAYGATALAPMPSASVRTVMAVNPGLLRNLRTMGRKPLITITFETVGRANWFTYVRHHGGIQLESDARALPVSSLNWPKSNNLWHRTTPRRAGSRSIPRSMCDRASPPTTPRSPTSRRTRPRSETSGPATPGSSCGSPPTVKAARTSLRRSAPTDDQPTFDRVRGRI